LSEFFKFLFGQIQEHCGEEFHIDGVCFSYPVEFEQAKIELIRDAILNLGYEVSNEQMEPIAAVIGFAQNHTIHDNECVLVFDFGGGTIDVACVQNRANGFRLVSKPSGSNTCGGQDIDMLIYNDIEKKIKSQTGLEITNHGMVDYSILNSCRRLKELFSGNNPLYEISVPLVVNGTFRTFRYSLNRESFNNIVYPKVTEAISIAKKVYSETVSKGYEVDKILLIGGSSKLTLISELLSSNFPNKPIETCGEKDIAVALGNLLSCADEQQIPEKSGKEEKVKDIPNLNKERSITCRQCGSKSCYKLQDEPGYYCLDCGWKGKNIIVHF
jgi:molecular chaperone DnaK (HSP70)